MTLREWKNKYNFSNSTLSCAGCKHCEYDGDLNIFYCGKMCQDTSDAAIIDCKVDTYKSNCKEVLEE